MLRKWTPLDGFLTSLISGSPCLGPPLLSWDWTTRKANRSLGQEALLLCSPSARLSKMPLINLSMTFRPLIYPRVTRLGQLGANISPDRSSLTPQVLIGNFLEHNYPLLYELQHINLLCLYLPKEDGVSPDAEYITEIIFSIFLQ